MTDEQRHGDGVSDPDQGGESQGQAYKGNNDKPAHPDDPVVTHVLTEHATAHDEDDGAERDRSR